MLKPEESLCIIIVSLLELSNKIIGNYSYGLNHQLDVLLIAGIAFQCESCKSSLIAVSFFVAFNTHSEKQWLITKTGPEEEEHEKEKIRPTEGTAFAASLSW